MSNYNQAQKNILNFLLPRKYKLISPIDSIKTLSDEFTYVCSCGKEKIRCYYDIVNNLKGEELNNINYTPKCCLSKLSNTNPNYKWYTDDSISDYSTEDEKWIKYQQYWVSNKGKVIGKRGENLLKDGVVKTGKKTFTLLEIMVKVFKDENDDKIPYFKDNIIHADNICFRDNYLSYINTLSIDDIKNIEYKILDEFEDYKIYSNGIIIRRAGGKIKNEKFPNFEKYNNRLVIKMKDQNRYNVDILVIMAFSPFFDGEEEKYKTYLNELDIIHTEGDYSDCSIDKLQVRYKDISKEHQRKKREDQRIKDLHDYITSFLENISGELISPIKEVKNIQSEFEYKCKCENIFKRSVKNIKENEGSECSTCRSKIIKNINSLNEDCIFIDGVKYIKFDYGWISENGDFINNNKEPISVKKDGYVKVAGKTINARHIIVKAYKIPHYEMLEREGFFVKTKDGTGRIQPNNLFVWGNGMKEIIHLPLSKEFNDKLSLLEKKTNSPYFFFLNEPPSSDYKTHIMFPGIIVYKNGYLRMSEDSYTIGRIKPTGYRDIHIKGKNYYIHRIVCFLFNPIEGKHNLEDYKDLDVNHKNGDKGYNDSSNLEWVTKSENIKHAIENELTGYTYPVNQYEIREDGTKGNFIKKYPCIKYAVKESGQSYSYIINMCQGKSKPYKYYWEFVNEKDIEKSQTSKRVKLTVDKPKITIED